MESSEMWCCKRMEKISWTDRVGNEEVLRRVKEERNIVRTVNRGKANWIGHVLCWNCLLKQVIRGEIEGRVEVTRRRGRKGKQLIADIKEMREYWKLKEEALLVEIKCINVRRNTTVFSNF
jgi:hypothetical protein